MNWEFSESYGLYHMTTAPHAEAEKIAVLSKKAITALKKGKIDTHIGTII